MRVQVNLLFTSCPDQLISKSHMCLQREDQEEEEKVVPGATRIMTMTTLDARVF